MAVSVAVIIAVGVDNDHCHEVLGMSVGTPVAKPTWTELLRKLTRRGLRDVKLVVSNAHDGIKAAVSKVFQLLGSAAEQVHFMRNLPAHRQERPSRGLGLHRHRFCQETDRCRTDPAKDPQARHHHGTTLTMTCSPR